MSDSTGKSRGLCQTSVGNLQRRYHSKNIFLSPGRDSNTRPIDYKSIALNRLSYRGALKIIFPSILKGFAPLHRAIGEAPPYAQ